MFEAIDSWDVPRHLRRPGLPAIYGTKKPMNTGLTGFFFTFLSVEPAGVSDLRSLFPPTPKREPDSSADALAPLRPLVHKQACEPRSTEVLNGYAVLELTGH